MKFTESLCFKFGSICGYISVISFIFAFCLQEFLFSNPFFLFCVWLPSCLALMCSIFVFPIVGIILFFKYLFSDSALNVKAVKTNPLNETQKHPKIYALLFSFFALSVVLKILNLFIKNSHLSLEQSGILLTFYLIMLGLIFALLIGILISFLFNKQLVIKQRDKQINFVFFNNLFRYAGFALFIAAPLIAYLIFSSGIHKLPF